MRFALLAVPFLVMPAGAAAPPPSGIQLVHATAEAHEKAGRIAEAEAVYRRYFALRPSDFEACRALGDFLVLHMWDGPDRFTGTAAALESCVPLQPRDLALRYELAATYWLAASRNPGLADADKRRLADAGLVHAEHALRANPRLDDVLVARRLLLELKANATAEPAARAQYQEQAEATVARRRELLARGEVETSGSKGGFVPPPPPPPPPAPAQVAPPAARAPRPAPALPVPPPPPGPVRVGGAIKEPKKLKNAAPVYPDIAKQARVQGVVILEVTISPQGKITDVAVLRGIPLLDAAAIEAVRQWEYTPTLLNGVPVPVIMTVTVNFRLS
jgi:TonB family protein